VIKLTLEMFYRLDSMIRRELKISIWKSDKGHKKVLIGGGGGEEVADT
jgi:hypothetical protein